MHRSLVQSWKRPVDYQLCESFSISMKSIVEGSLLSHDSKVKISLPTPGGIWNLNVANLFFLLWHLDPRLTIALLKLSGMLFAEYPFFTPSKNHEHSSHCVCKKALPNLFRRSEWNLSGWLFFRARSLFLVLPPHLWLSSTLLQATLTPMLSPWTSWASDSESAWPKWLGTWAQWKALTPQIHCVCALFLISAPVPPSGRQPWWHPPWPTTTTPCTHTTGQRPSTISPQPSSNPTDSTHRSQPHVAYPHLQKCLRPMALHSSQLHLLMQIPLFGCHQLAPSHRVCHLSPPLSCLFRPLCMPQPQRPPQLHTVSLCPSQGPFPCSPPTQPPQPQLLLQQLSAHPCQCQQPPVLSRQAAEQTVNLTDPGGQKWEPSKLFLNVLQ